MLLPVQIAFPCSSLDLLYNRGALNAPRRFSSSDDVRVGDGQCPAETFRGEHQFCGAAHALRGHVLDDDVAESLAGWADHDRPVLFQPAHSQIVSRSIRHELPTYLDASACRRPCTVLDGVGRQFVEGKTNRLRGVSTNGDVRAIAFEPIRAGHERLELALYKVAEWRAAPSLRDQHVRCHGKTLHALRELLLKLLKRACVAGGLTNHRLDYGKLIFHSMGEFIQQEFLVVLADA